MENKEDKEVKEDKENYLYYKCIKDSPNPLKFTCFRDNYDEFSKEITEVFYIKMKNNTNKIKNKAFDKYIIQNEIKKNIIVDLVD